MNTDKQNIAEQLLQIGFEENDAEPGTYEFYEDKELLFYTFINADNLVNLENYQIRQLRSQCKLSSKEFEKLTNGKLSNTQYLKILQKQKVI